MKPNRLFNTKEYISDNFLCSMCCLKACCKQDQSENGFLQGRELLEKETNICEIIKSRRYFNKALNFLLTKRQRKYLRERTRYVMLIWPSKRLQKNQVWKRLRQKEWCKPSSRLRIMICQKISTKSNRANWQVRVKLVPQKLTNKTQVAEIKLRQE